MKLGVSQSPVQSDGAVNLHPSWAALSYLSKAASRRVPSRWAVDAESGTLVARAKGGAHLRVTPSRICMRGRQWLGGGGRGGGGGAGLAAFVLRFVLFFVEVVDVLVVQVVDVGSSSSWTRW